MLFTDDLQLEQTNKAKREKAHFAHCTGFTFSLTTDKDMYI